MGHIAAYERESEYYSWITLKLFPPRRVESLEQAHVYVKESSVFLVVYVVFVIISDFKNWEM